MIEKKYWKLMITTLSEYLQRSDTDLINKAIDEYLSDIDL